MARKKRSKRRPPRVIIESPYSGNIPKNIQYTLECLHDSYYHRGEAPYASHMLYTRLPDSQIPYSHYDYCGHVIDSPTSRHGREHGFLCQDSWRSVADLCAVYADFGLSEGMKIGIQRSREMGIPVVYRYLYDD